MTKPKAKTEMNVPIVRGDSVATHDAERQAKQENPKTPEKTQAELEAEQRVIDVQRGYRRRVLATGAVDFQALHDFWTSPSEETMREHVDGYRAKTSGFLLDPAIIRTVE